MWCCAGRGKVTPALLKRLEAEGIADKEVSASLATDRIIPVAHGPLLEDDRRNDGRTAEDMRRRKRSGG